MIALIFHDLRIAIRVGGGFGLSLAFFFIIVIFCKKINYKDIIYFENKDYKNNNILNSIFYAEKVINGNIIINFLLLFNLSNIGL